jgi:Xaa-Pro aminopeptidase
MRQSEEGLVAGLLDAQRKAQSLFAETQAQSLIRAGAKESEINESIYALAESMYGISRYWHKRIVRAGRNTLAPYDENPPDLTVGEDDIAFLDFGPVFEDWEADFGRTYVVGNESCAATSKRHSRAASAIFTNILRSPRQSCTRMRRSWRRKPAGNMVAPLPAT